MKQTKKPTTVRLTPDNLAYCHEHGTAATIDFATNLLHEQCYRNGLRSFHRLTIPKQAVKNGIKTQIRMRQEVWDYCTLNGIPKSVFVNYALNLVKPSNNANRYNK